MKIEKEKKIIKLMIEIYSKGHDKKILEQNNEMLELLNYAWQRLDKCPFKDEKKFCSKCSIHCYQPEMRKKVKEVMKYSGPRLVFKHPILLIKHVFQSVGVDR